MSNALNRVKTACEFLRFSPSKSRFNRFLCVLDSPAMDSSSVRKHSGCQYKVTAIFAGAAVVNKK